MAGWKGCWICWWRRKWKMSAQDSGVLSWHSAEGKGAAVQTIWSVFTRLSNHSSLTIAASSLKTQTQTTWIWKEKMWPAARVWWRGALTAIHLGDFFEERKKECKGHITVVCFLAQLILRNVVYIKKKSWMHFINLNLKPEASLRLKQFESLLSRSHAEKRKQSYFMMRWPCLV